MKRRILQKLGRLIFWDASYIVISAEEFILRMHEDEYRDGFVQKRDVLRIRRFFKKLSGAYYSDEAFDQALARLASAGIIKLGVDDDCQASFQTSRIANPEKYQDTLDAIRKEHDIGERLGIGGFKCITMAECAEQR